APRGDPAAPGRPPCLVPQGGPPRRPRAEDAPPPFSVHGSSRDGLAPEHGTGRASPVSSPALHVEGTESPCRDTSHDHHASLLEDLAPTTATDGAADGVQRDHLPAPSPGRVDGRPHAAGDLPGQ